MNSESKLFHLLDWLISYFVQHIWSIGMTEELLYTCLSSQPLIVNVPRWTTISSRLFIIFSRSLNHVTSYIKALLFLFMVVLCLLLGIILFGKIVICKFSYASFVFCNLWSLQCPFMKNCANMNPWRGQKKVSVVLCLRQRQWQQLFIFLHNKLLCVLVWCRLYSVLQVPLQHQIKARDWIAMSHVSTGWQWINGAG